MTADWNTNQLEIQLLETEPVFCACLMQSQLPIQPAQLDQWPRNQLLTLNLLCNYFKSIEYWFSVQLQYNTLPFAGGEFICWKYAISTSIEKWCACCARHMIYECLILAACRDLLLVGCGCCFSAPCSSGPTAQRTQAEPGFQQGSGSPPPGAWFPPGPQHQRKLTMSCWCHWTLLTAGQRHTEWVIILQNASSHFSNVISDVMTHSLLWVSPQWLAGGWDPGKTGASLLLSPEMGTCQCLRVSAAVLGSSFCSLPAVPPGGSLPQSPLSLTSASLRIPWEGQINKTALYRNAVMNFSAHSERKHPHAAAWSGSRGHACGRGKERRGRTLVFVLSPLVVSVGTYAWYCWSLGPAGILSVVSVAALSSGHLLWLSFVGPLSFPKEITPD